MKDYNKLYKMLQNNTGRIYQSIDKTKIVYEDWCTNLSELKEIEESGFTIGAIFGHNNVVEIWFN